MAFLLNAKRRLSLLDGGGLNVPLCIFGVGNRNWGLS
jgi:hypothetical protein